VQRDGERLKRYELPNLTAYNETVPQLAIYWNYRMFLFTVIPNTWTCWKSIVQRRFRSWHGWKIILLRNAMQMTTGGNNPRGERAVGLVDAPAADQYLPAYSLTRLHVRTKDNNIYVNLFISGSAQITVA
jgi:hypothetical protein